MKKKMLILLFTSILVLNGCADSNEPIKDEVAEKTEKVEMSKDVDKEVTAELDATIQGDIINLVVNTNAVDGSIFEMLITDDNLNIATNFITVENGIAKGNLDINPDWEPGYLRATGSMRFNLDDHPQPDHVKEVYGEHGQLLSGKNIEENNLGGYNLDMKDVNIAYPNEEIVAEVSAKPLIAALNELIEASNGILLEVKPKYDNDWTIVHATISDAWYNTEEHNKERFVEMTSEGIQTMINNSGLFPENKIIDVYFYDTYDKELASPKILGGYKIKN